MLIIKQEFSVQTHEQLWLDENWYSSSCDWPIVLLSFATFYPIKTPQSCGAEEGREDGWTQIALRLTLSIRMELPRNREASTEGLWLLVFMFGWCFGSVSCFGPNLDSEFTFLLPAGRSECFFQTAIKNGTMEVEYQVTASVVRKQTLALSRVTFKCLYFWNLTHSQLFTDASRVQIRFSVHYSDVKTVNI